MDNSPQDLKPDPENVIRLIEMAQRYGLHAAVNVGRIESAAAEHARQYGHRLAFGCCRPPEAA